VFAFPLFLGPRKAGQALLDVAIPLSALCETMVRWDVWRVACSNKGREVQYIATASRAAVSAEGRPLTPSRFVLLAYFLCTLTSFLQISIYLKGSLGR